MKKTLTLILAALTFSAFSQTLKLGHINTEEIIRAMPELTAAQTDLENHARELDETLRTMGTELENRYAAFQANQANMSELIQQTRFRELQDLQARIEDFQQNARRSMEQRQQALFTPIFDRVRVAIEEVAKENNYAYVFETSGGTLLYARESDDISELVRRKLNIR